MAKEKSIKFRFLAAVSLITVLMTAGIWLRPASAQNPGLTSNKTDEQLPIASDKPSQAKAVVFKVSRG